MTTKKTFGKRALSLLLTLLMVISLVPVSLFSAFAAEVETVAVGATAAPYDGVPVTPEKITSSNYQNFGLTDSNWSAYNGYYGIRNAKELYGFANLVNGGDRYVNAVLLQDIVVNKTVSSSGATYEWVPIGASSGTSFMGTFDGNGCTISGLYCNYVTATGVGLFGSIGASAQSNSVNIKNVVLANSYICGSNGVGGIVGRAIGYGATISNCGVSEDVMVVKSIDSATPYTGGIIGQYDGLAVSALQKYKVCCTVSNCVNLGTVQILIYDFKGSVNNRYNIGSITGTYATEDNAFEFIDVNNCYYLSGHLKDKNGNSLKADGTVVDIGKGGETNRMSSGDCTSLSSASASHSCLSVTHKEVNPTCEYSGLSEYSFCLICGKVTSGTKKVLEMLNHNYDSNGFCKICGAFQPASINANGVYEISTPGQLYWFADFVNAGNVNADAILLNGFSQVNYAETIGNVIIGTAENNYKGTFDGNGNYIYVDLSGEESIALFGYLNGATIKNLKVSGDITVSGKFGAGFASHTYGNTVFEKCLSNVNIRTSVIGDGTHGGLVGVAESGTLTINNCAFAGRITGVNTNSCGGFVGWSNVTTKISNSYNSATFTTDEANCYTFGRNPSKYTITNCYYLYEFGTSNSGSVKKTVAEFRGGEVAYLLQGEQAEHIWGQEIGNNYYPVLDGKKVNFGYECGAEVKTYSNNQVFAEVTEHKYQNNICTVCGSYLSAPDSDGDGVYEISNVDQLYWFAQQVLDGNDEIKGILTDDITVNENVLNADGTLNGDGSNFREWTPIGDDVNRFSGSFDGNGHVIKGLYHNSNKSQIGLFGYVYNATIQNVGVEDSYFCGRTYVGGVIGKGSDNTIIKNCYNTGTIKNKDYYIGGVIGYGYSGEMSNCYNAGVVNGINTVGAVAGNIGRLTVENCYYLAGSATDSTGAIKEGIGSANTLIGDVTDKVKSKTAEQFANGEVAYLLQGEQTEHIWGQEIGTEDYPVFGGDKVYYGYITCDETVDTIGYTNLETSEETKPGHSYTSGSCTVCGKDCEHTGGTATCNKKAVCDDCGMEYGDFDSYKHEGERTPEFRFDTPYETESSKECYAELYLTCADCNEFVTSTSGYASLVDAKEPTDCMNPGYEIYETTLEIDGVYYPVSHKVTLKSDNHTGEFVNGFCTECGGYEPATLNDNGTPDDEWDDYYEISNAGQLYWYAQKLNEENVELHAMLLNDIIVPEDAPNWTPINCTTAYFDGNFKTISGLKCVDTEAEYVGLFGLEGWWYDISNLHITDSYFEGKDCVGAVVACLNNGGYVKNCYVTNTTVKGDSSNVGILVGDLGSGNMVNCYADTDTLAGYYNSSYAEIKNSYYLADTDDGEGGKTAEQFASGEVAYLLQSGVEGEDIYDDDYNYIETIIPEIWGQKIGEDTYPVFGGDKVYYVTNCKSENIYSNTNENDQHKVVDGACANCGLSNSTLMEIELLKTAIKLTSETADENNVLESKKEPLDVIYQELLAVGKQEESGPLSRLDLVKMALSSYRNQLQAGIADGTWVKADYTEIDAAAAEIESSGATTDKMSAKLEEIKSELSTMKESSETSKADVAVLMKEVETLKDCINGNHIFENGNCTICGAMDGIAQVKGYSISLGGNIAVNYYVVLADEVLADENAEMVFTVPSGGSTYEVRISVSSVTPDANGYYMFTCEVAAKEMTSKIAAQIVTSDKESDVFEYTVKQYAEYIISEAEKVQQNAGGIAGGGISNTATPQQMAYVKAAPLVKAMLNYGANAQLYFNHNTDILANATLDEVDKALVDNLDLSEYNMSATGSEEGVAFYGGTLSLKSETAIKLYFMVEGDVSALTVTVNGEETEFVKNGNLYELKISDIPAHLLGAMYEVKIGGLTLNYGAFSYGQLAMGTDKTELKNAIKALYAYYEEAVYYAG